MTAVRIAAMLAALSVAAACGSAGAMTTGVATKSATAAESQPGWDVLDASDAGLLQRFAWTPATCDSGGSCVAR